MKQIWQSLKTTTSFARWKRELKFKGSIKQKSLLIIISSILLTTFITYGLLNTFYLNSHKEHMKRYISNLLTTIESDYTHLEEAIEWVEKNLNLNIYVLESVEAFLGGVPANVDKDMILSVSDQQQLEMGNIVINEIEATDMEIRLLLFIMRVKDKELGEKILFMHVPINNLKGAEAVFSKLTILVALLSVGITIIIGKKIFGKSYSQLQDIKLAVMEVSKGNLDTKISQNSSDEVGEIIQIFNEMSKYLKNGHNRVKEYMDDISHEIKTPLALVKGYNQALMDQLVRGEEEQRQYYRLIDREVDRIHKLIQHFLDFSKLEANSVELELQPIVFAQSVEDIMMKYKPIFKEKGIQLDMKLDYGVIISADEDRLEQIIQNIIQNAIKYSKDNVRIDITMETKMDTCVLAISDNGIGISEKDLAVITKRFYRVNKVRSREESGTGLGLPIVEKLVNLHGGMLFIESQLGVGTTVKLEFPILDSED